MILKRSEYINILCQADGGKLGEAEPQRKALRYVYLPPWTLQYLQSPLMTTLPGSGDSGTAKVREDEGERERNIFS